MIHSEILTHAGYSQDTIRRNIQNMSRVTADSLSWRKWTRQKIILTAIAKEGPRKDVSGLNLNQIVTKATRSWNRTLSILPGLKETKRKVLIVDDDEDVLELLQGTFRKAGDYEILTASDGSDALKVAREESPDVLLLDLMLPGITGLEICRVLKADPATKRLSIIIVTAKADEFDRINGFETGADDYVVKPFSPREVLLRVQAVLRRRNAITPVEASLKAGPLILDRSRHNVSLDGDDLKLTTTEFKLLTALLESRGRVLGRARLLNEVWGYESAFNTRTVDTHIRRLRLKLGFFGSQIQTVRGFGYRIEDKKR